MADQVEVGPSSSTPTGSSLKLVNADNSESSSPRTRTAKSIFGLGKGITDDDAQITGSRLPTRRQVLRCAKYHIGKNVFTASKKNMWHAAKAVYLQVVPFYKKANIPNITERN